MKTTFETRAIMIVLMVSCLGVGVVHAQTQVKALVIGGGGGQVASPSSQILVTVGQPISGGSGSGSGGFGAGFWEMFQAAMLTAVPDEPPIFRNQLFQNAPNPFNPMTTIRFTLNKEAPTRIEVFDLMGRRVARLLNETVAAGEHSIVFRPDHLASGVYLLRLQAGSFCASSRLVLLK